LAESRECIVPKKKPDREAERPVRDRVIFVGAPPDDIELGCGGTIQIFAERGYRVECIYLTKGNYSGSPIEREQESVAACKLLGVPAENITFGEFPDTRIPENVDTIKFLQDSYLRSFRGRDAVANDVYAVFLHSSNDIHQDHQAIARCGVTAFRHCPRIYAYESPSSIGAFNPRAFIFLSEAQRDRKWEALQCHKSQLALARYYLEYQSMTELARFRGRQGGVEYAEAFEVIKESLDPPPMQNAASA
jgi:LmbE family N-acetylglucosaminyl deacetylase